MKQSQIILRLLFPTCQDAAKPVHPAMRPFHNPASSFKAGLMLNRLGLLSTRTNVSRIAKLLDQISDLTRIIAFIKAHALTFSFRRFRPFYRNTFYRGLYHSAIMPVGPINRQPNRHPGGVGKQTAFNTFLGPVRRVWACFFPRQAGLLSWRHPSTAKTSQSLSIRRSLSEPSPRVVEKPRQRSTLETLNGLCCWNTCRSHSERSTDTQCAVQRILRSLPCDPALLVYRHQSDACLDALAATAQFSPITRLKFYICSFFPLFSSLNPFRGTNASECIGHSGVIRIGSKLVIDCALAILLFLTIARVLFGFRGSA
jgi:hypothetical protein